MRQPDQGRPGCPRCGWQLEGEPDLPCSICWEARGDAALVTLLVGAAEEGAATAPGRLARAAGLLSALGDPDAAPALRAAAAHPVPAIRAAAIAGLGWSGAPADVTLLEAVLDDPDPGVRAAARDSAAELGGGRAADALAARLDRLAGEELLEALEGLAWLGDGRARAPLRALLPDALGARRPGRRGVVWALVRVGGRDDRRLVVDETLRLVGAGMAAGGRAAPGWRAREAAQQAILWICDAGGGECDRLRAGLAHVWPEQYGRPAPPAAPEGLPVREPLGERVVPRRTMAELLPAPPPGAPWPPAKFGGQPDWREAPAWPLGHGGRPLVFYGQLPLGVDDPRTGYVFLTHDPDASAWDPDGLDNCVVVQPGGVARLPTERRLSGPRLFARADEPDRYRRRSRREPYERFVRLEDGGDPVRWEWPEWRPSRDAHGDWNKIGGTPLFLQGEEVPAGEGWRLAFQFTASWAGEELGDGAECYGFARADGAAAFLWQGH